MTVGVVPELSTSVPSPGSPVSGAEVVMVIGAVAVPEAPTVNGA